MNEKKTQEQRVLDRLKAADGQWVNGYEVFLNEMHLTQYHRAIHNLQTNRSRYEYTGEIIASDFVDSFGFKSYRITPPVPQQGTLFAMYPPPKVIYPKPQSI